MSIYILLIIASLFGFLYCRNKPQKTCLIVLSLFCITFTAVSMFRYRVGTDYAAVYEATLNQIESGESTTRFEFLFQLLNNITMFLNGNILLLMGLCSIITIPLFFRFIKRHINHKYWMLAVFLFIGTTIFYATMNAVRQYLAIAVLVFGFDFLAERKYLHYLITIAIAMLFHVSAIFGICLLILYVLYTHDKHDYIIKLAMVIYIFSIIAIVVDTRNIIQLFDFILPTRYIGYLQSKFFTERNWAAILKLIVPNILLILSFLNREKLSKKDHRFDIYLTAWFLYVIISNAFYGINVFIRLGYYFDFYAMALIPLIYDFMKTTKTRIKYGVFFMKVAPMFLIGIITYYTSLNAYSIFYKGGHGVVPYHTYRQLQDQNSSS